MIRRNVASQPIYLPQLRLTADGTAVTASATIVVAKDGVAAASAGTLTHYAGGVWKYVPTQAETNCAIVGLILTATSADTVVLNLVTTGADTSAVALGAMASYTQPTGFLAATFPTTVASTTNITAGTLTTVTTLTNLPAITANWLTAAGIATDAITEIQSGLATQTSVDAVAVQLVDILSLVESVALTGAATYVAATSSTLTTGTLSSGTFADTFTADGVSHVHTDAAGAIEVIYDYEMGAAEIAVEALFRGRVTSSNDTILVQAYDWIGTDWETIWSQAGTNGTVVTDRAEPLLAKHTGTGANDGKVRIRFYAASGLSSATLYVDQLLVAKTVTQVDLTAGALADIVTQFGTGSTLTSLATAANLTALKTVADKIATVIYGTVTGAGTATEVFVSAGYTVTVTVDASGNRQSVVIT